MDDPKVRAYYDDLLKGSTGTRIDASVENLIESHKRIRQTLVDMPRPFPPHKDASFKFKLLWCIRYLRGKDM